MKKTILLAALSLGLVFNSAADSVLDEASCALTDGFTWTGPWSGADQTLPSGATLSSNDGDTTYKQLTLTVVYDWTQLQSCIGTSAEKTVELRKNGNDASKLSLFLQQDAQGSVTASAHSDGGTYATLADVNDYVHNNKLVLTLVMNKDGASIHTLGDTGLVSSEINASHKYSFDGQYSHIWLQDDGGSAVDAIYVFDTAQTTDQVLAISKAAAGVVPEPATATLSLLALAGLASRRRRA